MKKKILGRIPSPHPPPTKVLLTWYCGLIQSRFLLTDGGYEYLPVTVNIFAELFKFIVCCSLYLHLLLCKGKGEASTLLINIRSVIVIWSTLEPGFTDTQLMQDLITTDGHFLVVPHVHVHLSRVRLWSWTSPYSTSIICTPLHHGLSSTGPRETWTM